MTVQTVKLGRETFVIVRQKDFIRIQAQAARQAEQERQDAGDVAENRRRRKEPTLPYSELQKELGLA